MRAVNLQYSKNPENNLVVGSVPELKATLQALLEGKVFSVDFVTVAGHERSVPACRLAKYVGGGDKQPMANGNMLIELVDGKPKKSIRSFKLERMVSLACEELDLKVSK